MAHKIIDIPKNDCNITTVEAEFDRAMAYIAPCYGKKKVRNGTLNYECICNRNPECTEETKRQVSQ